MKYRWLLRCIAYAALSLVADQSALVKVTGVTTTLNKPSQNSRDSLTVTINAIVSNTGSGHVLFSPKNAFVQAAEMREGSGNWKVIMQGSYVGLPETKYPVCTRIGPGEQLKIQGISALLEAPASNPLRSPSAVRFYLSAYCETGHGVYGQSVVTEPFEVRPPAAKR